MGLVILFVAQLLSAIMGIYVQRTYEVYGNHWRENLFYSHVFSLLLFIPFTSQIISQFKTLAASEPLTLKSIPHTLASVLPFPILRALTNTPRQILYLLANSATQYLCIRGVNTLGARSSALTVTIVLNIRKLISLLFSVWLFGNRLAPGVILGATVVFTGAGIYGWESQRLGRERKRAAEAGKKAQ
jgi:solute carrier family 35 (UDP-xylose/UDP-N-acetylglucosamine transporter), member B4